MIMILTGYLLPHARSCCQEVRPAGRFPAFPGGIGPGQASAGCAAGTSLSAGRIGMGKAGWRADRQVSRLFWFCCLILADAAAVAFFTVNFRSASHTDASGAAQATHPAAGSTSPIRSASDPAVTWEVAGPVADLSVPLPGMPPIANPANIYADAAPDMLGAAVRGVPYRIYVPDSGGSTVTVINPATRRVIGTYHTGLNPQHVVPGYDMRTLYVTNDLSNSLTPINPRTGRPAGRNIGVDDPYNMYFTPDGRYSIVVAEARQNLDFRDPH